MFIFIIGIVVIAILGFLNYNSQKNQEGLGSYGVIPPSGTVYRCGDTDGLNYYKPNAAYVVENYNQYTYYPDKCVDDNTLKEAYCERFDSQKASYETYYCLRGKCLKNEKGYGYCSEVPAIKYRILKNNKYITECLEESQCILKLEFYDDYDPNPMNIYKCIRCVLE